MWVWGLGVGFVAFAVGAVFSILAFMDGQGFEGVWAPLAFAAVGKVMFWGFLVWGLAFRRRSSEE